MNINEFSSLRPGDKIENLMLGTKGVVSSITPGSVGVRWGPIADSTEFTYTLQSTAWMHWSKDGE